MEDLAVLKTKLENAKFISIADFRKQFTSMVKRESEKAVKVWDFKNHCYDEVLNVPAAFDIETTADPKARTSYMYVWQLCVNGLCTMGRTWGELVQLYQDLQPLMRHKKLPVYVHNLSYESSFILPRFMDDIGHLFATDLRTPVRFDIGYIELRDSLILSGLSLEKTADNLTKFCIKKMVGDLDYSKQRNSETPLTAKEKGYCLHDVTVLTAYIAEQILQYGDVVQIPMTNTGRVRDYMRELCLYKGKGTHKRRNKEYSGLMSKLTLTPEVYAMAKDAFAGGFTHAAHGHYAQTLKNVTSKDFTSSYPTVLCAEKFPMSAPEHVAYSSFDEYDRDRAAGYGMLLTLELTDVYDYKFSWEHYISYSKCIECDGAVLDNGRIVSANRIVITITDIDFELIKQLYSFDAIIIDAYRYKMDYLPKEFVQGVLHLYQAKTTLKGVKGKEAEYQNKKGMLNSSYGMCVTDIVHQVYYYDFAWHQDDGASVEEQIDTYNEDDKRFTSYLWGVYCTAWARKNLWDGIMELKGDYVYSDTDSVKYLNAEKHENYFQRYNAKITRKLVDVCLHDGIDIDMIKPKTVKGKEKPLGVWDDDGVYKRFKTLGAKRYLTEDDSGIHMTVAGISKVKGCEYLCTGWAYKDGKEINSPFEKFADGMTIPAGYSGKTVCIYTDKPYEADITDYFGNTEHMQECGGVYLYESDYKMCILSEYKSYCTGGAGASDFRKKLHSKVRVAEAVNDEKNIH